MCLSPISAQLPPEGGRPQINSEGDLRLPCGKCNECISKRALEWATRAKHEISEHNENSFITLTYAPEKLNSNFIIKSDFQKFAKRLRKKLKNKIRYMVSYEYGSQYFRPHMHALIFGYSPNNQKFLKNTPSGHPLFTSPDIEEIWDKGFHSIGEANEKTAYYIASYALKGKKKNIYHPDTGEEVEISDSMNVSTRPAIGLKYLCKNAEQLVNSGEILPRYYIKQLEAEPERLQRLKEEFPEYASNIDLFPYYADLYNDNMASNIKNRSSGELYAKAVIDREKNSMCTTHFREDLHSSEETLRNRLLEKRLKFNRDNYVSHIKGA